MNKFEIVSKYINSDINLPKRSTAYAAGYDFEVAEDTLIYPIERLRDDMRAHHSGALTLEDMASLTKRVGAKPTLVPTGIKAQINSNQYLKLVVRSSLPLKHWLILANSEGIIDSDYYNNPDNEGEIFFQLINLSPFPILLKKGDKIGQGIFVDYHLAYGDSYGKGEKRLGGFGSTTNAPYIIGNYDNYESFKSFEPKWMTLSEDEKESLYKIINEISEPYQMTFDDIKDDLL